MTSCKASCPVGGIGSVSASMMSTVGLELTNFINPELTWKTVAKGSRSASRRSRKPVGRILKPGVELDGKSSKIVGEASVSEAEKLSVAVHGRRFGGKVEDVPIKKRRLMFQSASPPPRTPSPLCKEFEQLVATQSSRQLYPNLIAQQQSIGSDSTFAKVGHLVDIVKVQQETDPKSDYSEDFSGIEILAAAACNNSMGNNFDNAEEVPVVKDLSAQEGIDSSAFTSAIPLKETIESLDASKDLAHGEQMEGMSPSVAVLHDLPPEEDEGTLKDSVASREDRSHWDLNTTMDAWEQTCDEQIVNSQKNVLEGNSGDVMCSKKLENSEGCEMQRDHGDTQPGTECVTPMAGRVVSGEVHEDVHMHADSRGQRDGNNHLDGDVHKFEACPSSSESCFQGTVIPTLAENAMKKSIFSVAVANASPQVFSMDTCSWISEGNKIAESENSNIKLGKGYYDLEYSLDDSYDSDVSQDNHSNVVGIENETKPQEGCDAQYEDGELRESDVYCWQENETEDGKAEHVDYESDNGFDAVYNDAVSVPGKVEVGAECDQRFFSLDHFDSEEKINMRKAVRDTTGQHYLGGSLVTDVTEAELSKRESVKTSKMQLTKYFTERGGSEKNDIDNRVENGLSGESDGVIQKSKQSAGGQDLKESSQSVSSRLKLSGRDQSPDGCGVSSSDVTAEIDDRKFTVLRANRENPSPSSSAGIDKKDTRIMQRSRSTNLDDSYPHFVRVTGSDKLMRMDRPPLHMHDRSQGGGHWVDHSGDEWDSKQHHSYRYYGPYDAEHPGSKSVTVNSKGAYRRAIRRSPAHRDAPYGMFTGMAPMRDISTNSRGRSGRCAQGFDRGGTRIPRNGNHEPMLEDSEYAVRMPYYLERREGTFLPNHSRGAPHFSQPRKRSQSRSRSRSPQMCLLEKERNAGLRHFSRSPDLRYDARMDGVRFPFQKPSFAADEDAGFMSPPRNRFSLQQNSRWIDGRDCAVDHFRNRRSPVRMFRQSQRVDSEGVPGRLKSDGYFRPMIHPGRSADIAAADRGRRYESGNEHRRKYGDRFETHPGRHYDRDGFVRRIRDDAESGFVAHSSQDKDECARGPDRRQRDISWKVREEKGQVRNNHVRMYDSALKTFGMQEYDEDASPGRGRPS